MSVYFIAGAEDLWNPSNTTARVFCAEVALASEVLDVQSGLAAMFADEVRIDGHEFKAFVEAFARFMDPAIGVHDAGVRQLLRCCFEIVCALAMKLDLLPTGADATKAAASGRILIGS